MKHSSNVIYVDFTVSSAKKNIQLFSTLLNTVLPIDNMQVDKSEWTEKLTTRERHEQLKRDLEFIRQINSASYARK